MKTAARLIPVCVIAGLILACGSLAAPPAATVDVSTIVAATIRALVLPTATSALAVPTATQAPPTQAAPAGNPVSYAGVNFVIPTGLASGATSEAVAAVGDQGGPMWDVAPAFTRFTLQGYALQGSFWQPQIMVYPAQDYANSNTGAAMSLQRLQTILGSPSPNLNNDVLPRLPFANAEQIIGAQPVVLSFNGGKGLRVLAEYAQYNAPINNHDLFYHFEGLTSDGKSYIVATLPVTAPFLAPQSDPSSTVPPDGVPFPGISVTDPTVFASYYQTITNRLSTTTPESFGPSLAALDALVQSLRFDQ